MGTASNGNICITHFGQRPDSSPVQNGAGTQHRLTRACRRPAEEDVRSRWNGRACDFDRLAHSSSLFDLDDRIGPFRQWRTCHDLCGVTYPDSLPGNLSRRDDFDDAERRLARRQVNGMNGITIHQ